MKNLNLIIGLTVAATLVVGIYFARQAREAAGEAPPTGTEAVADESQDEISEGLVPDVTREDGIFRVGGIHVQVVIPTRPIKAYEETAYRFRFEDAGGKALALEAGKVKFNMSMDMGRHHYALEAAEDGWYVAKAPIPMCPSGKVRWYGNMDFSIDGAAYVGGFQFDIEP
jgi:hypothetical protein